MAAAARSVGPADDPSGEGWLSSAHVRHGQQGAHGRSPDAKRPRHAASDCSLCLRLLPFPEAVFRSLRVACDVTGWCELFPGKSQALRRCFRMWCSNLHCKSLSERGVLDNFGSWHFFTPRDEGSLWPFGFTFLRLLVSLLRGSMDTAFDSLRVKPSFINENIETCLELR